MSKNAAALSIGTLAVAAAGSTAAYGQSTPVQGRFEPMNTFTLEGGIIFSDYSSSLFSTPASTIFGGANPKLGIVPDNFNSPLNAKSDRGIYGAIYYRRDIDPIFDWRISGAFFDFKTNSRSLSGGVVLTDPFFGIVGTNSASYSEFDKLRFETFDFDFGHKITAPGLQWRTFVGLRGVHVSDKRGSDSLQNAVNFFPFFPPFIPTESQAFQARYDAHFLGVGPRIGADFRYGLTWAVVGSFSTSVSWGERDEKYVQVGATSLTAEQKNTDFIGNLSGMLGLSWSPSSTWDLVIGYRLDRWFNLRGDPGFATAVARNGDVTTQIPFLRVNVRY